MLGVKEIQTCIRELNNLNKRLGYQQEISDIIVDLCCLEKRLDDRETYGTPLNKERRCLYNECYEDRSEWQ